MNVAATMTLNPSAFLGGLSAAKRGLAGVVGPLLGLVGAGAGLAGAFAGVKNALDLGGSMSDLKAVTGAGVADLIILRQAFTDTGVGASALQPSIKLMQKALSGMNEEGGKTDQIFDILGLNMETLRGMGAADALQTIGTAINGLDKEADKTAVSMAIFGRSGDSLKSFFADPGAIDAARKSLGDMPAVMERNAALFDKVSDAMGRIKTKGVGLFAGIAQGVAPALDSLTTALDGIDLTGIGVKIGDALAAGLEIFRSGQLGEVLRLSLSAGFKSAINTLATGLLGAGTAFLALVSSKDVWAGIGGMLLASAKQLTAELLKLPVLIGAGIDTMLQSIWEKLGKTKLGAKLGLSDFSAKSLEENLADRQKTSSYGSTIEGLSSSARDDFSTALEMAKSGLANVAGVVGSMKAVQLFDVTDESARIDAIMSAATAKVRTNRELEEFFGEIDAAPAGGGQGNSEIAMASKMKTPSVDLADRLTKIGGMMGASGVDLQRSVARNTERAAKATESLFQLIQRSPGQFQAVAYGDV